MLPAALSPCDGYLALLLLLRLERVGVGASDHGINDRVLSLVHRSRDGATTAKSTDMPSVVVLHA